MATATTGGGGGGGGDSRRVGWRHRAHPSRLSPQHAQYDEIVARHDRSLAEGIPTYADPTSGFSVFTSDFLSRRGECCESGCRHCPWAGGDDTPADTADDTPADTADDTPDPS